MKPFYYLILAMALMLFSTAISLAGSKPSKQSNASYQCKHIGVPKVKPFKSKVKPKKNKILLDVHRFNYAKVSYPKYRSSEI